MTKKILAFFLPALLASRTAAAAETRLLGFYRVAFPSYRESLFNPGNETARALGLTAGPHWTLSQFAGLSFRALSLECRAEASFQAAKSPGGRWTTALAFHQVFVQKDFGGRLTILAGRSIQRWGTGYAFNPTDFAGPAKEINDPENRERRAVGRDLIKVEYFGESWSVALCELAPEKGGGGSDGWRPALRAYANIRHVDASGVILWRSGKSPLWGANFATTIGDRLEIHGEWTLQRGCDAAYHPAITGARTLYAADPVADLKKEDDRIYVQGLLGCHWTFPGNVFWVSEVYYRGQGYSAEEWRNVLDYLDYLSGLRDAVPADALRANRLWCLRVFSANGAMRNYWMNHLRIPVFKKTEATVTHLLNLADGGSALIPEVAGNVGKRFTFYAKSYIFLGRRRSEQGSFVQSSAIETGLRVIL